MSTKGDIQNQVPNLSEANPSNPLYGSTAEIMELARDIGNDRGDMPEICVWKEAIGVVGNKLLYIQAVHQESDVVCENIDAIRCVMGFSDGKKSIEMTNNAMGIPMNTIHNESSN